MLRSVKKQGDRHVIIRPLVWGDQDLELQTSWPTDVLPFLLRHSTTCWHLDLSSPCYSQVVVTPFAWSLAWTWRVATANPTWGWKGCQIGCFFGDHSQAYLTMLSHQLDPWLLFTRSSCVPSSLPKCLPAKELWILQLLSWRLYAPLSQMWTGKPVFSPHPSPGCKYWSPNFSPGL